jgi:small multidrug resistance pump
MSYLYLALAIVAEVIATSTMKASEQFTRPVPSIVVVLGYAGAFFFLSLVLKTMPVGIVYAVWSGLGIVLVAVVAAIAYRQIPDWPCALGMALIIAGVVVINVFSKMAVHP